MSDTKYLIPECGFKAALENIPKFKIAGLEEEIIKQALQDFVRWLSENPIVPTPKDVDKLYLDWQAVTEYDSSQMPLWASIEWQRRMFLAPKPVFIQEIRDLMDSYTSDDTGSRFNCNEHNEHVIEAYRRGQKAGSK